MEDNAELNINAEGDNNGIQCDTIVFGATLPNSNQYKSGTININTSQSGIVQTVVAGSYGIQYKTNLIINADTGFDFSTTRSYKHKGAGVTVGTSGKLKINANNKEFALAA